MIYQKVLLESDISKKVDTQILKDLFNKDGYSNAFDIELKIFLEKIDPNDAI